MRSSVLLSAAACAAGVCGTPLNLEKRALETEWTFQTLTETSTTELPPQTTWSTIEATGAPAPVEATTFTLPPTTTLVQGQQQAEPTTIQQGQPQQPQQQQQQQPAPTTEAIQAPAPEITAQPPAPTSNADDGGIIAWTSSWSTAWTDGGGGAAPTQQPASTMSSSTSSGAKPTDPYQETLLHHHNVHRSNHTSPSLGWSETLQASAQKLAARCVYEHDTDIDGGGYGQNIGYGVQADSIGEMITNLMYNQEMGFFSSLYGLATPVMDLFDSWGHFSQIVWKSTTEVGCATVVCDSLGNVDAGSSLPFTVCNYGPPGNSNGEYADNVLQPQGHPVLTV